MLRRNAAFHSAALKSLADPLPTNGVGEHRSGIVMPTLVVLFNRANRDMHRARSRWLARIVEDAGWWGRGCTRHTGNLSIDELGFVCVDLHDRSSFGALVGLRV
jgi:hypothetical protein